MPQRPVGPSANLAQAFVSLVVLVFFSRNLGCLDQELSYIEFFAGKGNVFNAVKEVYPAAAVDLEYLRDPRFKRNNPMDLNSDSGLALAIWLVLQGRLDSFYVLLATVCSSWVPTNAGTSKRSVIYAEGNTKLPYIADANCLTSRSILICLLVCCLGGTFLLEQPGSSLMRYYFRWVWLRQKIPVFRVAWWMKMYGAPTAKRHQAFTNNPYAEEYNLGKLKPSRYKSNVKTVRRWVDKAGKKRWAGT
ncbi:unnamed protein product, partial [Symbiodinium sp. CCMP2456]